MSRLALALALTPALVYAQARGATQPATPAQPGTGPVWSLPQSPQSSLVYAANGAVIGEIGKQARTSIELTEMPSYLPKAFIAVEDQRFYKHDGVDYTGLLGAGLDAITGDGLRGASTITQQLVGMVHPDIIDRSDRSPTRKLREQSAAREMEKHYTKDAILAAYLNRVDLGRKWFGVEAAARHYFGKPAARLTLAEAASLAALPKAPPTYDPVAHPAKNKERRDVILQLMVDQGYVTAEAAARAKLDSVKVAPNSGMAAPSDYFVDAVRKEADKFSIPVIEGGYRIYTTLDPLLQNSAVKHLVAWTTELEKKPGYKHLTMATRGVSTDYLQGAVIAMDPYTGDVKALVGGRNYPLAPFNRATSSLRQPGSSVKPIVYARAIEAGIPVNSIIPDSSIELEFPIGKMYKPGNSDGKFLGPLTMRQALILSRNPVAVQLGMAVGMDSVAAYAARLGIEGMKPYPSSAIGASDIHPIDIVTAYAAFANNGQAVTPRFITRIENSRGQAVYTAPAPMLQQVMDPRVAFIVRDMLHDAVERGTGTPARVSGVPVSGKTGTTNDNVDVWFTGVTPDLVATVWLGFDRPKTIQSTSTAAGTAGAFGGTYAAPIWQMMIADYYRAHRVGEFPPVPAGLVMAEIDRESGQLAVPMTPADRRMIEYFLPGTEPGALRGNPWLVPRWGPIGGK